MRARRRKEALLAYLLILPAMAVFAVFSFYPFLRNFKLMLYETPPVPGLPAHYVGLHQIIPTITSSQFTQSLVTTLLLVVLVVPVSLLAGLGLAVVAHRKLKGMAVYRMIFSSTVVSSVAVASVVFGTLLNPGGRPVALARHQPDPAGPRELDLGPPRGGAHHHLAVPGPVLHHHVGRAAVGARRAARGGAHRRRRPVDALLAHDGAAPLPHHLLRRGREHHLRLPGLRCGRHPHRAAERGAASTPTC